MHPTREVVLLLALLVAASTSLAPAHGAVHAPSVSAMPSATLSGAEPAFAIPEGSSLDPSGPVEVGVGGSPNSVVVDTANNTAFVACQFDQTVYAIDVKTDQVVQTYPVGSLPYPQAIAFDPANSTVYVANAGSNNVTAISASQLSEIASIPVGPSPEALAFNPANGLLYVADAGASELTLVSTVTNQVVATVPVQSDPVALAIDTKTHDVFVADSGTDNVSVLSGKTNTVVATAFVGTEPGPYGAIAYDPGDGDVYVANPGSDNVSVIGGANFTAFAAIPVGSGPSALAVDPAAGKVFVTNEYSDNVTIIATATQSVVASIPVGNDPGTDGAIAFNPTTGDVYVPNWGSDNVSIVSAVADSVVKSVPVQAAPDAVAVTPASTAVYVADEGASNVTVFQTTEVKFAATGLPNGANWSVTTGSPPVTTSEMTAHGKGAIALVVYSGTLQFTLGSPSGYGVRTITGPGTPTQSSADATGTTMTLAVRFGLLENLTFSESGLPNGLVWGVALISTTTHGGPAPKNATTNHTSVSFTVVAGGWKFAVTPSPSLYRPAPAHGTVSISTHAVTKKIRFTLPKATVAFHEYDLKPGTKWQVNITGPMNVTLVSTKATMSTLLESGNYTFEAWNFSSLHPHPTTGTFTVVAPGAPLVISITYTSEGGGGAPPAGPPPLSTFEAPRPVAVGETPPPSPR